MSDLKKKYPFTLPDNYMEDLTGRIMEQVSLEKHTSSNVRIGLRRLLKPALGVAAIALFAFFIGQIIFPKIVDKSQMIDNNIALSSNNTTVVNQKSDVQFDLDFNPSDEDILNYLVDEVDDVETFFAGL